MDSSEKTAAVQRMQDYIRAHAGSETFSFAGLYGAAGYSKRHADRLFKELLGQTPREYVQAVLLTGCGRPATRCWKLPWTAATRATRALPGPLRAGLP